MPKTIMIDIETYYDRDYSLSKLSTEDYVYSHLFELLSVSYKVDNEGAIFAFGKEAERHVRALPTEDAIVVAHNAKFDALALQRRFGKKFGLLLCTMSMGNAFTRAHIGSSSLGKMSEYFGLPAKGDLKTMGMRRGDFSQQDIMLLAGYNSRDVNNMYSIYHRLVRKMPRTELFVMDAVLRMYLEPQFILDEDILRAHLKKVQDDKQRLLDDAYMSKEILQSSEKLATVLRVLGVEPPLKTSPKTGKTTYAFAKSDKAFVDLLEHPSERVQAIVAARLGVRSTLEESRTERLLDIASKYGKLRVPLRYSGAHTHRLSGDENINLQNLARKSPIRHAIKAPPGKVIVYADASQIECRFLMTWAGESVVVDEFRAGEDVYCRFADVVYPDLAPITKAHERERFLGKQGMLSLGYGASHARFHQMLWSQGVKDITKADSHDVWKAFRNRHKKVTKLWWKMTETLGMMASAGFYGEAMSGPFKFRAAQIILPNGMTIDYPDLQIDTDFYYERRRGWGKPYMDKLYGAKLVENATQAATRIIVMDAIYPIFREFGLRPKLQVHDSLFYIVDDDGSKPQDVLDMLIERLSTPPVWMPGIPLAAEGKIGRVYAELG